MGVVTKIGMLPSVGLRHTSVPHYSGHVKRAQRPIAGHTRSGSAKRRAALERSQDTSAMFIAGFCVRNRCQVLKTKENKKKKKQELH
jgi:hypothetical protein